MRRHDLVTVVWVGCLLFGIPLSAQQIFLSIDSCRVWAIENNKSLRISREKIRKAAEDRQAAFTNYLPDFSATGAYLHNSRRLGLVSGADQAAIGALGSGLGEAFTGIGESVGALAQFAYQATQDPVFLQIAQQIQNGMGTLPDLQGLSDALNPDIRNLYTGVVSVTQPLYAGGKIAAYHRLTKYAEQLAGTYYDTEMQHVILGVDEAYWQVVSLAGKRRLAVSYLGLLNKMNSDVEKMIAEGMATRADGLSIEVKVNEAEMTLTKVENGLSLSRMLLCQLCGLPLESEIKLADEDLESLSVTEPLDQGNAVLKALEFRPELRSLGLAEKMYHEKVNITRSDYLPQVVLTGNYIVTNPSLYNGFEKKFRGMWNVGIMMQVPLWHWGEGLHKVRSAKAEARISGLQLQDTREKIELQVNQAAFRLKEAWKKAVRADRNMARAEENLRIATLGFEEGVIPASTALEAHTAWLQAQTERIDAQIEQKLTKVYLRKAVGDLGLYHE